MLGAYLGLVALVLVLSTINAVSWRDPAHGVYAAYVFVLALAQASLSGVAGYYFWPDDPAWNDLAAVVFPMLGLALLALFVWTFVRPLPWRWAEALLGLYGLAGLVLTGANEDGARGRAGGRSSGRSTSRATTSRSCRRRALLRTRPGRRFSVEPASCFNSR